MAGKDNLVILSPEKAREYGRKGGKVKSMRKKLGQQIRRAKEKGFTNKDIDVMVKSMVDADCSAYEILKYLKEIQKDVHPSQRVALANAYMNQHKLIHGEKIKTENVHHVINWNDVIDSCVIEDDEQESD